jgi:hypothetical protein
VFADIPDWTSAVVRLPYPNWDSQARPATQVVAARSPEPLTFHVKQWVRRTYRFPLVANSGRRSRLRIASTGPNGSTRMFMYCAHPRPCKKAGPQACFAAELYFLLQASPAVLNRISACFSDLIEFSSLLPMRSHREEGGISSRTGGDHVAVPSMAAVCPTPVGLEWTAAHLSCLARPAVRPAPDAVLRAKT